MKWVDLQEYPRPCYAWGKRRVFNRGDEAGNDFQVRDLQREGRSKASNR